MPNLIGQIIGHGKYRIIANLGTGGMATVYKAEHLLLDFDVAIKVVDRHLTGEHDPLPRLRREVSSVLSLTHPHILPIYEFDRFTSDDDHPIYYIVMKLVEGRSLKDRLQDLVKSDQHMPFEEVICVLQVIAEALDYAHAAGVIHRDVKPGNILLANDGGIYLSDFGLAKFFGASSSLTKNGTTVGTLAYIAPEQAQGQSVDHRADLYSLAVVAYEMLAGRPPFVADNPAVVMLSHIHDAPPSPQTFNPFISEAAEQVLLRGLNKSPGARFQSAKGFYDSLRAALIVEEIIVQESSDELAFRQPMPPSSEEIRTVLISDENQPLTLVVESKQERTSPSIIISIGFVLLFIVGAFLLHQAPPRPEPVPTRDSVTPNDSWSTGDVLHGEQTVGFTGFAISDPQIYRIVVMETERHIDAFPETDVQFEQGLCLTVDVLVMSGQPDYYGVIFHYLDQGDSLRLGINEQEGTAQVIWLRGTSREELATAKDIGNALGSVGSDGWHSILMAIQPERVDVWLNRYPILGFDGKLLSEGKIGLFACSSAKENALPVEVNYRDFKATPYFSECRP